MNRPRMLTSISLALVASAGMLASCESDGSKTKETSKTTPAAAATATEAATPLTVERRIEGKMRARVRAIDYVTRQITLEDEQIHAMTFTVGPKVQRLNEVRLGDYVDMAYSATLIAELRPATAEEHASPIMLVGVSDRADRTEDPSGYAARGVKVVTTVQAIDIPNMRLTLKGPMGDEVTVRARSEENMRKLSIGDTIVLTYVEAMAVALDKSNH